MEGWRDARTSVHAAAGIGFKFLAPSPQFNPEVLLDDDDSSRTRASIHRGGSIHSVNSRSLSRAQALSQEGRNSIQQSIPENPFDDRGEDVHQLKSPFDDTTYAVHDPESDIERSPTPPPTQTSSSTPPEEPYHVFGKKQKWFVVITIGMAGLFSGLSSNIYFPALDAIANVSSSYLLLFGFCHTYFVTRTSTYLSKMSI